MKKLLLLTILISGILMLNSCSKKDVKPDERQEETKPDEQPETSNDITFDTYKLDGEKGVIELASGTETSKIYFYGEFNGEPEENLLVNAVTYQSPGGDSLYHFVLDGEYRVERMYITFPDGSFDTTLLTLSYPHPDTTVVSGYYYNWETNQSRLHFSAKTYYKNDKLVALPGGRFSLGEFKKESLKTIIGSVAAAVGVIEVTGAVVALATTAPAWAIVGAGVAIVAFANSAMASDEMILAETSFQGPPNPVTHGEPELPGTSDQPGEEQENAENIFKDAAIVRGILAANGIALSDSRWNSQDAGVIKAVLEENGCAVSLPLSRDSGVVQMLLEDKGITRLPESIGELTQLNILSLKGNKLPMIPSSIGNLWQLTALDLRINQLTYIPYEIANLQPSLKSLGLAYNQLTEIPRAIGNLVNLTELLLGYNQLTMLPDEIINLTKLSLLSLTNNQLTSLPYNIGNLTSLEKLFVENNQLTEIPESIGNLTQLTHLILDHNQLGNVPNSIGNLKNLFWLYLHHNQLTGIASSFGNLTHLETLAVSNNNLTSVPESIGNLTQLKFLYVSDNNLNCLPQSVWNLGSSVVAWDGNTRVIDGKLYGLCSFGDTNCDDIPCSEQ